MSEAASEFIPILSVAAESGIALVVSLHDVAPETRPACDEMLHDLKRAGVQTTSLLVIPDYHHHGRSMADPDFVDWLHAREDEGHEIVLHGYFHARERRADEAVGARFVTRIYTQDEGEFYDLSYADAFARITRGQKEFQDAGFSPLGFIAPAWLLNSEGERAARDAGFEYTVRLRGVTDLRENRHDPVRSLVYSTRSEWRCSASLAWNAILARTVSTAPLVRLSLHPPDLGARPIWRQAMKLAARFSDARQPISYREWVAEKRRSA